MAPPPSPYPSFLMDELVVRFLLLIPPEDPADLARAALVSKQWHRVVTGAIFRRRYIEFHRRAPLLGYMLDFVHSTRFVPMSSFRLRHADRREMEPILASHGRVLLHPIRHREMDHIRLVVWDPITDKQWELPGLLKWTIFCWDAAVVCAAGDGCSHLDCHFKVVVVGISSGGRALSCFYSSEAGSWSDPGLASGGGDGGCPMQVCVPVGNDLYFWGRGSHAEMLIFKYDLLTNQMCTITVHCRDEARLGGLLIATEDGRLGLATTRNSTLRLRLWEQERLVEHSHSAHGLLPDDALRDLLDNPWVDAFADTRAGGVIFLRTCVGYFTVNLNSVRRKKVGECLLGATRIIPYVRFCTPAPGIVSTDKGPGASVVVSTDVEAGAGVAVPKDEGPGDVTVSTDEGHEMYVVVSTDEGPGPSMSSA